MPGGYRSVSIMLDPRIYRLTAIQKTAYRFGNQCHVFIENTPEGMIRVTLRAKEASQDMALLEGEFCNEALDQELREVVGKETEGIRNLILAHAFSRTSLLDPASETTDYHTALQQVASPAMKEPRCPAQPNEHDPTSRHRP